MDCDYCYETMIGIHQSPPSSPLLEETSSALGNVEKAGSSDAACPSSPPAHKLAGSSATSISLPGPSASSSEMSKPSTAVKDRSKVVATEESMVQTAIRVGKFYGQELRLGVENNAAGDCSIEVCMDQLNFRPEFDQMRLDEGEPQFYRETWFREIERVAWGTVFSESTEGEWKTGWEFMRQPRNYEHALGDMVMAGIAHCNRVDILVIYTNANSFRSFDLIRADTFGGRPAVVDVPIIVAYNGYHYESLVPADADASERSAEFKKAILRNEVESVISGNSELEELYGCQKFVASKSYSQVTSTAGPAQSPVRNSSPLSSPKSQVEVVVTSKPPTRKQSKFPGRHALEPKTVVVGSSPQKRKPPVEVAEGAVKKPKPNGVPKSPAQTCSDLLF